jgi:hypothetical protein
MNFSVPYVCIISKSAESEDDVVPCNFIGHISEVHTATIDGGSMHLCNVSLLL